MYEAKGWREHKLLAEVMGYAELGYRQEMHQFSRAKAAFEPREKSVISIALSGKRSKNPTEFRCLY